MAWKIFYSILFESFIFPHCKKFWRRAGKGVWGGGDHPPAGMKNKAKPWRGLLPCAKKKSCAILPDLGAFLCEEQGGQAGGMHQHATSAGGPLWGLAPLWDWIKMGTHGRSHPLTQLSKWRLSQVDHEASMPSMKCCSV